jgi:hypothetical protein
LRAPINTDPTDHPLLAEAIECFRYGFFDGAVARCMRLALISPELEVASAGVAWFSQVYSGREECLEKARRAPFIKQIVAGAGQGGTGAAELAWLFFDCWDGKHWRFPNDVTLRQKGPFDQVLSFIDNQHGVLVSFHPSAVLRLARLAVEGSQRQIAKSLVNSILGWRSAFASGADLEELAILMATLGAPEFLWGDWAAFFYQHVKLCHALTIRSSAFVDAEDFASWAAAQDRESEHVLARVIAIAPPGLTETMMAMTPYFGWDGFDNAIAKLASAHARARCESSARSELTTTGSLSWYDHPDIRTRYFWFDMLDSHERAFVTNGDWALGCTPTEDYSMGLAQWWRLIESVFGRIVCDKLGKLYDENPQWLARDLKNLSPQSLSSEAVFLKKLAVAGAREKMTLADILRVLEKCVLKPRPPTDEGSVVRQKATEYFAPHADILRTAVQTNEAQPFLSLTTIDWFRNRASHSRAIFETDAVVGRLLAKKIVDLLFLPTLRAWGFEARIPVFTL